MRWRKWLFCVMAVVLALGVSACSKEKKAEKSVKQFTDQKANAIEQYGKKPMNKAIKAAHIGEEHTRNVDKAIENMNGH